MLSGVYIAWTPELEDKSLFKIGWSEIDVHERVRSLQTGNGYKLEVYGHIETKDPNVEKFLHRKLAKWRTQGEWFKLTKDQIDVVLAIYSEYVEDSSNEDYSDEDSNSFISEKIEYVCEWCKFVYQDQAMLEKHLNMCSLRDKLEKMKL